MAKIVKVEISKGVAQVIELDASVEIHITDFDDEERRIYREVEGEITLVEITVL